MPMKTLTLVYDDEQGSVPEVTAFIDAATARIAALETALADGHTRLSALENALAKAEGRLAKIADAFAD